MRCDQRLARVSAAVLLSAALLSYNASAARLTVRALLEDGSGAGAGVAVTISNGQFSAEDQTGGNSRVTFQNVPGGSTTVIGQRNNLQGSRTVNVSGNNQTVELTLQPQAAPPPPLLPQPPSVNLSINDGADCAVNRNAALRNTVSGPTPKGYRASENGSLIRAAAWQPYATAPAFQLSEGAGTKTVYLQVQSFVSGTELVSNIDSDTIELVTPKANATLAINNGAASTTNRTVTLNNTTSFEPAGTNPQYIASENPNFQGASWQTYTPGTAPKFTVTEGVGTKTVHFLASQEICGAKIGTSPVSDSIQLNLEAVPITPLEPDPVAANCEFSGKAFYDRAVSVAWRFQCFVGTLLTLDNGTLLPLATGELVCVGKMGLQDGNAEMHVSKPAGFPTGNYGLRNGWQFSMNTVPADAQRTWGDNGRSLVTYRRFAASQTFRVGIRNVQLTRLGGNCATALNEAL